MAKIDRFARPLPGKTILALGALECAAPLPNQDGVAAVDTRFCARPIAPGRSFQFCDRCRPRLLDAGWAVSEHSKERFTLYSPKRRAA